MTTEPEITPAIDPDAAHLDAFRAPDIGMDEDLADDVQRPDDEGVFEDEREPVPELMDREAFWTVFNVAFAAPAMFMPDMKPLEIQPDEAPAARAASDAAYALLEIYYPKALMPMNETVAHIMVLAPFLMTKAMVVKAVLEARNRPPPRDVTPPEEGEPEFKTSRPEPTSGPAHWMDAEGVSA